MALDTLAYVEHLTDAGVDPKTAKAHAKAMVEHILPQTATKADLENVTHTLTLRLIATVGAFNALLFALIKLT